MSTRSGGLTHISLSSAVAALVFCLWVSLVARGERIKPQPVDGRIEWVYDYEEGKRLSSETDKPMFVVFRCER